MNSSGIIEKVCLFMNGFVAFYFVHTGHEKINNPQWFVQAVARHGLASPQVAHWAQYLAVFEIIIGFVVIAGLCHRAARCYSTLICISVLGTFSFYLLAVLIEKGPLLDCGCSGITKFNIGEALIRNIIFLIPMLYIFICETRSVRDSQCSTDSRTR